MEQFSFDLGGTVKVYSVTSNSEKTAYGMGFVKAF
jgi:hypothetical protein